jgi:GAF domain-containing protein
MQNQERLNLKRLNDVLSLAVRGEPMETLLDSLLLAARALAGTDLAVSIYMAEEDGSTLTLTASAGLEADAVRALARLPVGEHEAACGRAAFLGQAVVVEDVYAEPRMVPYLDLARTHGIRACWSWPLHTPDGGIMGTLAFYHPQPCVPSAAQDEDIGHVADMAALLIERELRERRNRRRLADVGAESERRRRLYETVLDNTPDLNYVFGLDHRFTYANAVLLRMWTMRSARTASNSATRTGTPPCTAAKSSR